MKRKSKELLSLLPVMTLILVSGSLFSTISSAAPRITMQYGACCPADQAYGVHAGKLAELIKEYSNGEIEVNVMYGGVLGGEQDMAHQVQTGTIQMAGITSNNLGQLAPSVNVMVLPYMNSSMEDVVGEYGLIAPGPYLDELNKRVLKESGSIRILGGFTNSFRTFFVKDRCVEKLEDLKGLKIRMPKNPVMEAMWAAWGVSTYPIAWSETFSAIQQGVVDAFDSPLDVVLRMGFYEYIKYITPTHYTPQAALSIINENWLKSLAPEDQDIIIRAEKDTDRWHYNWVKEDQVTLKETLIKEHGVTFCELQDEDVWKEKALATWPDLYKYVGGGKEWVETTLEYKKSHTMK